MSGTEIGFVPAEVKLGSLRPKYDENAATSNARAYLNSTTEDVNQRVIVVKEGDSERRR